MAMDRQAQRMAAVEAQRQTSCSATPGSPECSDAAARFQSEGSLYRTLQARYNQCQQRSLTAYPYGGYRFGSYQMGMWFDPLGID